ncbi:unnamed protein product [Menidia menidia]|uniref:(Atlantic silverside) hypothetical protein n=1 Tax=Menidia menidia TaxID=238744 RepID=A0A8S4AH32_9TELE|nr:unnamed protein product [Menidia menidia]
MQLQLLIQMLSTSGGPAEHQRSTSREAPPPAPLPRRQRLSLPLHSPAPARGLPPHTAGHQLGGGQSGTPTGRIAAVESLNARSPSYEMRHPDPVSTRRLSAPGPFPALIVSPGNRMRGSVSPR